MKIVISILFFIGFLITGMIATDQTSAESEVFRLYFLGGQSNMAGHGLVRELPDSLLSVDVDIWIFDGNPTGDNDDKGGMGKWEHLEPGHGSGFNSDGVKNMLSHKFGPELSFAKTIKRLYPDEKIAIIKYAKGGSSIDSLAARTFGCWEIDFQSGDNQFDYFLKTVNSALSNLDINDNGIPDQLVPAGIVWMQGESDAIISEDIPKRYSYNLKRLMDLIRATFRDDDLPVVIGKISDSGLDNNGKTWPYGELVQYAQEEFVRNDKNAAIVRSTKDYQYSDPYHYDTFGYIDLGKNFAEAIYSLDTLYAPKRVSEH